MAIPPEGKPPPPAGGGAATRSGFDPQTGIYSSLVHFDHHSKIPTDPRLDAATHVLSHFPSSKLAEARVALIDSATGHRVTYAHVARSVASLAAGLHLCLGIVKGDVVLVLSPNSVTYPVVCLAVLSIGAVVTTANPLNTAAEIAKQARDSGAKLAIAAPQEMHKLSETGLPVLPTTGPTVNDDRRNDLSVEELIENCEPIDIPAEQKPRQSDTAAILYSSGTTGTSKGVVLTHANFIAVVTMFKWSMEQSKSNDDVFLCFVPMFHIYGLVFFGLGLFCTGSTTVVMRRYDFQEMLEAIQKHKVRNIPAVPPVILALVKHDSRSHNLSSLRRMGSGAAPLSKELAEAFRKKFPWVELRTGYGLTESCGATTFFATDQESKSRPGSSARLLPSFSAKVVDPATGAALPPYGEGELWLKSPTVMKEYLGNKEANDAAFDPEGWLKTGDLCYFDDEGYVYIVDRIKELIKYNGYQVAPAELEAVLTSHPRIVDAAVVPVEDEEAGQIPIAYVVKGAGNDDLTEDQVMEFVARQVAPYKKIRGVRFVGAVPKSAAGKILRRELMLSERQGEPLASKL
ncbi:probable CoA ligase CCL5 [Andrographis paniculata]|uniref:probable CoA ligase CCL5 n=1 Tax=Andrographis paniculata TaxID=175694 RepID=UPI0021E96709|nr:probable CoA ligase CCL5 [Andrographis paniculata]